MAAQKDKDSLTLLGMVFFGAAHGWRKGGQKAPPPSRESVTHIQQ